MQRVCLLVALVCGCDAPSATFRSKATLGHAPPADRLLVVTNIEGPAFEASMFRGFRLGLENRLARCGVQAMVVRSTTSIADRFALHPVAEMTISQSTVPQKLRLDPFTNDTRNTVWFALDLEDLASRQTTWVARSRFEFVARHNRHDSVVGVQLATLLASRLRDDGVLAHCPATEWPNIDAAIDTEPDPEPVEPIDATVSSPQP